MLGGRLVLLLLASLADSDQNVIFDKLLVLLAHSKDLGNDAEVENLAPLEQDRFIYQVFDLHQELIVHHVSWVSKEAVQGRLYLKSALLTHPKGAVPH